MSASTIDGIKRSLGVSLFALMLTSCVPRPAPLPLPAGEAVSLSTPQGHIVGRIFAATGPTKVLVVVLHGDLPVGPPRYHYDFAAAIAKAVPGITAAGLMRPGYGDPAGGRSDGSYGDYAGDNYTPEAIDALNAAIVALKTRLHPKQVVLVGHSGGAAVAADLMAVHPDIAGEVVLVSCPCDVPTWRAYMAGKFSTPRWTRSVRSLSPQALVANLSPNARVHIWVGAKDATAVPRFSEAFYDALRRRGIAADLHILPNRKHGILLDPQVIKGVEAVAAEASR